MAKKRPAPEPVAPTAEEAATPALSPEKLAKLKSLTERAQSLLDEIAMDNRSDGWKYHEASDGRKSRSGYAIWDDGTITRDFQMADQSGEFRDDGFGRRMDFYGPIDSSYYWTGSLLATLAEEGISTGLKLPCHLIDRNREDGSVGGIAKHYSALPCDRETAMAARMLMLEFRYERLKLIADREG